MSNIEANIKLVNTRLQELIKNYGALKKENEELSQKFSILQQKEKDHKEIINGLNQKISILQAASGQMKEPEQKEFEKRINIYLKEIDKCISILSE